MTSYVNIPLPRSQIPEAPCCMSIDIEIQAMKTTCTFVIQDIETRTHLPELLWQLDIISLSLVCVWSGHRAINHVNGCMSPLLVPILVIAPFGAFYLPPILACQYCFTSSHLLKAQWTQGKQLMAQIKKSYGIWSVVDTGMKPMYHSLDKILYHLFNSRTTDCKYTVALVAPLHHSCSTYHHLFLAVSFILDPQTGAGSGVNKTGGARSQVLVTVIAAE